MLKRTARVCALILVITYFSEQCYSLEIHYEHVGDNDLTADEDLFAPDTIQYEEESVVEVPQQTPDGFFKFLFSENTYNDKNAVETNKIEDLDNKELDNTRSRVVRQAYHAQAGLYPQLPSSSPYNQYQPNPNYNNQNPQWRSPNNYTQHGYNPNSGVSNFYPSTQQNSTYGNHPYNSNNPSQAQPPYYNNKPPSSSYPGFPPRNSTVYNSGTRMPPYGNNNSYAGYPTKTPSYRPGNISNSYHPSQRPPYSPTYPGNGHHVSYNNSINSRPYNNQNTSHWSGNTGPNSRPFSGQNSQVPQYYNSNPNQNPYGQPPNSSFPHKVPNQPYQNPLSNGGQYPYNSNTNYNAGPYGQSPQNYNSNPQTQNPDPYNNSFNGQFGANGYTGNPHGSNTYNLVNGNNPTIPNHPPYGSAPGRYPQGINGTAHDPTRVSPEYFSYPH